MEKVLILGASGFIGKNLTSFLKSKYEIVAYDKNEPLTKFEDSITFIKGNFESECRWDEILEGIDCVIHLISTTNVTSSINGIEVEIRENVIPTIRVLESMNKKCIKKMVFLSSGGAVYGKVRQVPIYESCELRPICSYGVQKKTLESYIQLYNDKCQMKNVILRVSNPYGIGQDEKRMQGIIPLFLRKILNEEEITVWGDGENIRDYLNMSDLMNAIEKSLQYSGSVEIFNIGSGKGYSINEIIRIIERVLKDREVKVQYTAARDNDVKINILDNTLARTELKWEPQVSVEEGIQSLCFLMRNRAK